MMFKITKPMWKKTNNQSHSIMFHVKYLVSTPVSKVKCKYSFSSPSVKQWYQRIPTYYILQQVRSTNYDRPMNNLSAAPKLQLQSERDTQCSPSLNHQSDSHPLHPAQQITRLYFIKKNPIGAHYRRQSNFLVCDKAERTRCLKIFIARFTQLFTILPMWCTEWTWTSDGSLTCDLSLCLIQHRPSHYPGSPPPASPPLFLLSFCLCSRSRRICNFKAFLAVF